MVTVLLKDRGHPRTPTHQLFDGLSVAAFEPKLRRGQGGVTRKREAERLRLCKCKKKKKTAALIAVSLKVVSQKS